ncbi:MAG: proteasome assembly chaperone family protein [Candidatus Verstraetearchaeota archaeon]|nr:proteasome assembly chaperone family protein [Candidatus Verstraetearchaeota archaeon]
MREDVSIVEVESIAAKNPALLCGLPDVGLVGIISVSHIIKELGMNEVGYIDSELFPPLVVFHQGEPTYPIRIFQKEEILAVFSETALPPESLYPLTKMIVSWAKEKGVSMVVSLGGIGVPNRIDIDEPKVYGASSTQELRERVLQNGISLMEEGFLVGPYGLIAKHSKALKVPNLILLAESFPNYPDPGAAASAVEALKKFVPLPVDMKSLRDRSEEIRMNARELMRKTAEHMQKMGKSQEYELPLMYV